MSFRNYIKQIIKKYKLIGEEVLHRTHSNKNCDIKPKLQTIENIKKIKKKWRFIFNGL